MPSSGVVDFGREALLGRDDLWDYVVTQLPGIGAERPLAAAMLALLLQRALLAAEDVLTLLRAHGRGLDLLVQQLDVRAQLQRSATLELRRCLAEPGAHLIPPCDLPAACLCRTRLSA